MPDSNLLEQIRQRSNSLSKSESKVAEVILKDPQKATRLSIAALAQEATVSEPTVNRFCRSFNIKGYPDFKIQLAQSLAGGTPYVSRSVDQDDNADEYSEKIFSATMAALDNARQGVNAKAVTSAVDYLIQAKQIFFFGLGASGSVAIDAQHKFFRFNLPVIAYDDVLMQRMVAASLNTGDVVVVISYTGRTRELVEIASIARDNGAVVIAITAPDSPLADVCTVALEASDQENTDVYMPMTSRIVHLTLLDVLATGVTLRRGVDFHKHLKKIKDSLKATRFPAPDQEL